mmetsp:Transcript_38933/g.70250  ORF Transcript_38933/g.70250 Transcript_38933/m.70250 type:complete len:88 (-) Transcript_38933:184-447(-)
MASREVLQLFRQSMRAAGGFTDYNFRHYFVRRLREDFRAFDRSIRQGKIDDASQKEFIEKAQAQLGMLERQSTVSQLYKSTGPSGRR